MAITVKPWSGANGNVVIEAKAITFCGITFNNTAGAPTTVTVFDNATTNSGTILMQITIPTGAAGVQFLPNPLRCAAGVTINSGAAIGAGSAYVF